MCGRSSQGYRGKGQRKSLWSHGWRLHVVMMNWVGCIKQRKVVDRDSLWMVGGLKSERWCRLSQCLLVLEIACSKVRWVQPMVIKALGCGHDVSGVNVAFPCCPKQLLKMAVLIGFIGQGRYGGEGIVKDDMELG